MVRKTRILLIGLLALVLLIGSAVQASQSSIQNTYIVPNLKPAWTTGIINDQAGLAGILVEDLDQDGTLDIASCSLGYAYVLNASGGEAYDTTWYSQYLGCLQITSGDRDTNGVRELYLTTTTGKVVVIDGESHATLGSFDLEWSINGHSIAVGEVDGDGDVEIVVTHPDVTQVYDANTFATEWLADGLGGNEVQIGNIDDDALPEIVVNGNPAHILNANAQTQEWAYSGGFGVDMDLGNVDDDPREEIVYIADWEHAYVLDGKSLQLHIDSLDDLAAVAAVDVNGDEICEVIIGNGQWGNITGYDGSNGTRLWGIGNPEHGVSTISAGDANNDGVVEVLWGAGLTSSGVDALFVGSWESEAVLWQSQDLDPYFMVAAGDVDNDGQGEFISLTFSSNSGYTGGTLQIYDGESRQVEWSSIIIAFYQTAHLALGQLDADPQLEILVGGYMGYDSVLQAYDGASHVVEWTNEGVEYAELEGLVVKNIDADEIDEIFISLSDQRVLVYNGASDQIQWDSGLFDSPILDLSVGDLDGDGGQELAVLTSQYVYVYDTTDWTQKLARVLGGGVQVAIAEADAYGGAELLLVTGSSETDFTLQARDATSFDLHWQRALGHVLVKDLISQDVDQDNIREFVLLGAEGDLLTRKSLLKIGSRSYPSISEYQNQGYWGTIHSMALSDVDNDGQPEFLFGASSLIQLNEVEARSSHLAYLPLAMKPCLPIYSDNFSNPASGWPIVDTGDTLYEYINGEYRMLVRIENWGAGARSGFIAQDYVASVDLRNPNNVFGSYGLLFGLAYDWSSYYTLEIYPDGWYGIYRQDTTGFTTLAEGYSTAILQGSAKNTIKVERNNYLIKAYANGQFLTSVTDTTIYDPRYLGLIVWSYNKMNVDIRFDNYTVYPVTCGGVVPLLNTTAGWQLTPSAQPLEFVPHGHGTDQIRLPSINK